MQIEALATTQDCRQNFLRLRRRENEFHVRRRFLQRFEQRIERGRRKHVHFVDEINFVATFRRRVAHVVAQFAHVFHAVVARAVDLDDIEAVARSDFFAIIANAARRDRRARSRSSALSPECAPSKFSRRRAARRKDMRARDDFVRPHSSTFARHDSARPNRRTSAVDTFSRKPGSSRR